MKVVKPITCKEMLEKLKGHLRGRSERDYLLFRLGINLGLSIKTLLEIQIESVRNQQEIRVNNHIIPIPESLQLEITAYLGDRIDGLLFPSRLGKTLQRHQIYTILKNAAYYVDFSQPVGVMTLRKTFAYWSYQEGTSLQTLRSYLNHQSIRITREYIGLKEEPNSSFSAIDL